MLWFTEHHFKELMSTLHRLSTGLEKMTTFADRVAGDVTRIARDVQSISDQIKAAAQTGGDLTPALDKLDAAVDTLDQLAGITSQNQPQGTTGTVNPPSTPGAGNSLPPTLIQSGQLSPSSTPANSGQTPTAGSTQVPPSIGTSGASLSGSPDSVTTQVSSGGGTQQPGQNTVVNSGQTVGSVQVNPTSLTLKKGESSQLSVNILGTDGNSMNSGQTPSFSSSDTGVANVDQNGIVTGIGQGSTTISVSVAGQSTTVSVSVSA